MLMKAKSRSESKSKAPVHFLDRRFEKAKKGLFFEPEAKTYRWIAPRER